MFNNNFNNFNNFKSHNIAGINKTPSNIAGINKNPMNIGGINKMPKPNDPFVVNYIFFMGEIQVIHKLVPFRLLMKLWNVPFC